MQAKHSELWDTGGQGAHRAPGGGCPCRQFLIQLPLPLKMQALEEQEMAVQKRVSKDSPPASSQTGEGHISVGKIAPGAAFPRSRRSSHSQTRSGTPVG